MNTPAQCGVIKPPKADIYSEAPHSGGANARAPSLQHTTAPAERNPHPWRAPTLTDRNPACGGGPSGAASPQHTTAPPTRTPHIPSRTPSRATNDPTGGRWTTASSFQHANSPACLNAQIVPNEYMSAVTPTAMNGPSGANPGYRSQPLHQ